MKVGSNLRSFKNTEFLAVSVLMKNMEDICDLKLETVYDSRWIRLKEVTYKQNGLRKRQEIIHSHNSCGILIHNTSRDVFVFVRQFRPAVFMHETGWQGLPSNRTECVDFNEGQLMQGFTIELCAGILDKEEKSIAETAAEEVLEECGYRVKAEDLKLILSTRNNSLHSGTLQNLFYACVTDDMKAEGYGGGNTEEGEFIQIVEVKVEDVVASIFDDTLPKPVGLTFALIWYMSTRFTPSMKPSAKGSVDGSGRIDCENNKGKKRKPGTDVSNSTGSKKSKLDENGGQNDIDGATDLSKCLDRRLKVTDVAVKDVEKNRELQLYRLHYKQNGRQKAWDFFYVKSTCATLVHNVSRNVFVLIRKFSPAVYGSMYLQQSQEIGNVKIDASSACLVQLCSASYSVGDQPREAASKSVLSTLGYSVPPADFQKIIRSRSNVGIAGSLINLLYVEVTDEMKAKPAGNAAELPSPKNHDTCRSADDGDESREDKDYEIIEVPVLCDDGLETDGLEMLMEQNKNPMTLSLALLWYYYQNNLIDRL